MNQVIFISGTPCVGKSTIAKKLADKIDGELIDVKKLAIENDLTLGVDSERGYTIVDIEKFDKFLQNKLDSSKPFIVESHLSHFFSNPDVVIILRLDPKILEKRLASRNYSEFKIRENLEAEALGVCSSEAHDLHSDKVKEIDTSDLNVEEVLNLVIDCINNPDNFSIGEIDFMGWLIENP